MCNAHANHSQMVDYFLKDKSSVTCLECLQEWAHDAANRIQELHDEIDELEVGQ